MVPGSTPQSESDRVELRLICTSDLHAHIHPFDYVRDTQVPQRGLSVIAPLIEQARCEAPHSLLLDNGDCLQGTPLADLQAKLMSTGGRDTHPMIAAMNKLGYDAATLGNHDFNYGLPFLEQAIAQASFPHVIANIVRTRGASPAEDEYIAPPYALLRVPLGAQSGAPQSLTVGVLGLTPKRTVEWDRYHLSGRAEARGILETAAFWVPIMRAQGAEVVVALCHSGPGRLEAPDDEEDAALAVAALDGVDAVVAGHTHKQLPGPDYEGAKGIDAARGLLAGKPAVQPGNYGNCIGLIDLAFERAPDNGLVLAHSKSEIRSPAPSSNGARVLLEASTPAHEATRARMMSRIGNSKIALTSYFPQLAPSTALKLVADAQMWQARKLLDQHASDVPLLSVATPFAAGGSQGPGNFVAVPAGSVDARHVAALSPFPNNLSVIEIDGRTLRLWLERVAAAYSTVLPGDSDVPLLNADMPIYNCDVIYGVSYEFDLSAAPSFDTRGAATAQPGQPGRVKNLRHKGREITDNDRFRVAVNAYRAAGGGRFHMLSGSTALAYCDEPLAETIARYVDNFSPVDVDAHPVMRFTKIGATTILAGAPEAEIPVMDDVPSIQRLEGLDAKGFARFRVTL